MLKFEYVQIEKPDPEINVIVGTAHFIKSIEDIYEALITAVPNIQFGVAFCEASADRLVRFEGTDEVLEKYAYDNALKIGAGHAFVILLKNAYPINVLRHLKATDEVINIYVATSNPLQIIIAETEQGRGIVGVIDGAAPTGVEDAAKKNVRKQFLRKIGYKL